MDRLRARATGVGSAISGAKGRLTNHLQQAQDKLKIGEYKELASSLQTYMKDRSAMHVDALKDAGYGMKDRAGDAWVQHKKDAEKKLFELSAPMRAKVLLALRESVKSGITADPDMCKCVKTRIEDLVDLFWDDLTITVEQSLEDTKQARLGNEITAHEELSVLGEEHCVCSPRWWRAQILYHLLPFDLSIFGNMKDPIWWILMVFMCVPCFTFLPAPLCDIPIRVPFFILYLLLVVTGYPADEFQLVQFIMAIKGLQFVCSGVLMMCYAAYLYYMCVNLGGTHSCDKTGPGAKQDLAVSLVDWLGTCILVWCAFLFLPCSERSAGLREVMPEEESEEYENISSSQLDPKSGCCGAKSWDRAKGGRLRGWLTYDLGIFLLSVALCYVLMGVDAGHLRQGGEPSDGFPPPGKVLDHALGDSTKWAGHAAIYWARIVYALLSFPFLFFWIPGLQGILTHTRITGYNRCGMCVPYVLRPDPKGDE